MNNFWQMQLHPSKPNWSINNIDNILLQYAVIGMGDEWVNDGGAPIRFKKDMSIGDIVVIRHQGSPRYLVEVISNAIKNEGNDQIDVWFEIYRKVRILSNEGVKFKSIYKKAKNKNWSDGLFALTSFQTANDWDFAHYWYNQVKKNETMKRYNLLLKSNHNLILTGAPGTGKTYLAKLIAAELLKLDDVRSLKGNKHFGFVQFHPSYDYTDFVEGLRPIDQNETGSIGFERRDGIFKEFCKRAALDSKRDDTTPFNKLYELLLQKIKDGEIDRFAQRTGKQIFIKEISGNNNVILFVPKEQEESEERTYTISYNRLNKLSKVFPDKVYLESINNIDKEIRQAIGGCNTSAYWAVLNQIWELSNSTNNSNENLPYVFVIDEINRGELSKIFGELFFSIDPGYRGTEGNVITQYQKLVGEGDIFEEGFYIPENVYIIGTMNDIDRSVESMDFAMRRRFAWTEVSAAESYQNMIEGSSDFTDAEKADIKCRMDNLNQAILKPELGLGESFQIGAAYFRKLLIYKDLGTEEAFNMLWENHLSGLIYEYLRGNKNAQEQLNELRDAYYKRPGIA